MKSNHSFSKAAHAFIATLFMMFSCQVAAQTTEFYNSGKIIPPNLPLSDGVRNGSLFFLSGQVGLTPGAGKLVSGGMKAEAKQVLENIKLSLESRSSGMQDLIQCTVYLTDMNDWPSFNETYQNYFKGRYPARTVVGVAQLPLQAKVELQCISAVPS